MVVGVTLLIQAFIVIALSWLLARICLFVRLPALLGMIAAGALAAVIPVPENVLGGWGGIDFSGDMGMAGSAVPSLAAISPSVRLAILAVVLLRAGLGLIRQDVVGGGRLALGIGIMPMLGDAAAVALGGVYLLGLPPASAVALGFLVAAISPAIVIPGVLDILERATPEQRRVPSALVVGAPLDNIAALVGLGIAIDFALQGDVTWTGAVAQTLYAIGVGVAAGVIVGVALSCLGRRWPTWAGHFFVVFLLWGLAVGLIAVGTWASFSFVLSILSLGMTIRELAPQMATALMPGLRRVWDVTQYALFALIGYAVDVEAMSLVGGAAIAVIVMGQGGRALAAALVTGSARMSRDERLACIYCYVPKATIQAAFASMALDRGIPGGEVLLSTGVLAIVVTAPIGVVTLHRGARLLLGPRVTAEKPPS